MLPSERVISCVNVYGRWGRFSSVACRTWDAQLQGTGIRARFAAKEGSCEAIAITELWTGVVLES